MKFHSVINSTFSAQSIFFFLSDIFYLNLSIALLFIKKANQLKLLLIALIFPFVILSQEKTLDKIYLNRLGATALLGEYIEDNNNTRFLEFRFATLTYVGDFKIFEQTELEQFIIDIQSMISAISKKASKTINTSNYILVYKGKGKGIKVYDMDEKNCYISLNNLRDLEAWLKGKEIYSKS